MVRRCAMTTSALVVLSYLAAAACAPGQKEGAAAEAESAADATSRLSGAVVLGAVQALRPAPAAVYVPEEPCSKAGGQCLAEAECPAGKLAEERGLCPKQRASGVECCHGLSVVEDRCRQRGGHCVPVKDCSRATRDLRATDCRQDESCCILAF